MAIHWMPCFLCLIRKNDFKGEGEIEIGENYNKFSKFKISICPLCKGKGRLAIKPYKEKPWEKTRKDYL